jgi:GTPase SAR1 family protein
MSMATCRLVFIAGPMAVGKTTLISRLMAGELEGFRRQLGLDAADEWHVLDKTELPTLRAESAARKILRSGATGTAGPEALVGYHSGFATTSARASTAARVGSAT